MSIFKKNTLQQIKIKISLWQGLTSLCIIELIKKWQNIVADMA